MKKLFLLICVMIQFSINAQDTIKTVSLNDVIVNGIRATSLTPVTQKTITSDVINKQYFGQEMTYIVSNSPSVVTQSDGGHPNGYTTFKIRGIDQTRVNMTLNGCPLNESEDQGVYFSNYPNFGVNIQSMQIQRGVGTTSNGTTSYGGSINFIGKNGFEKGTNTLVSLGQYNTQTYNVNYGSGLNNNFALYYSLSAFSTDGYKYNSGSNGFSGFLSTGYYGKTNTLKLTAFSGKSVNGMAWRAVPESEINLDPRTNHIFNKLSAPDDFGQKFVQLQYINIINEKSNLTISGFFNKLNGCYDYWETGHRSLYLNSNFYGVISNYHFSNSNLTFDGGFQINKYNRNHKNIESYTYIPTINETDTSYYEHGLYENTGYKKDVSAYSKLSYTVDKLILFTDIQLRKTNFEYIGDSIMVPIMWKFINPKFGLVYKYSNNITYYTSIGRTHREPTRNDMFGGWDNLYSPKYKKEQLNNTTNETVTDFEIGSYVNTNNLNLQYNLYYMSFKNERTSDGVIGQSSLPKTIIVPNSYRSGLEIDLKYKISTHLTFLNNTTVSKNSMTYNDVKSEQLYSPKLIMNSGLEWTDKYMSFVIDSKYHSSSYINVLNTLTTPSFLTFNTNLTFKYKNYMLSLQTINFTDRKYYTNGYEGSTNYDGIGNGERNLFVNIPRSYYLTFKTAF